MNFEESVAYLFEKLGTHKIMALASSSHDHVMVRLVSCVFYNDKIYFKTDKNFRKTQQLFENPNVAVCAGGIQVEGTAKNLGLVVDEPGRVFEKLYEKGNKHCIFCNQWVEKKDAEISKTKRGTINIWHIACVPVYKPLLGDEMEEFING